MTKETKKFIPKHDSKIKIVKKESYITSDRVTHDNKEDAMKHQDFIDLGIALEKRQFMIQTIIDVLKTKSYAHAGKLFCELADMSGY